MPRPAGNGDANVTGYSLQDEKLTIRDHLDPDKHWIGEALGVPTQTEIAATVGTASKPGDSPFVARADHVHKVDPLVLPRNITWSPTINNHSLGTGGFTVARCIAQRVSGSSTSLVQLTLHIAYGTGGGPTGDMSCTLPFSYPDRFVGYGVAEATQRFDVSWYNISVGGSGALIRSAIYRPTATETSRVVENTIPMNSILPAQTWSSGSWIMLFASYITQDGT